MRYLERYSRRFGLDVSLPGGAWTAGELPEGRGWGTREGGGRIMMGVRVVGVKKIKEREYEVRWRVEG